MSRRYGFQHDTDDHRDYNFGEAFRSPEVLQPDGQWMKFLPEKEYQAHPSFEPSACVSFTTLNCLEILHKRKYDEEINFSDRFLAYISGTERTGNSPRTVASALRKQGTPEQAFWPFGGETFEEFYTKPSAIAFQNAKRFLKNYQVNYEVVPTEPKLIMQALQSSPLGVSVSAWYQNDEGLYFKPEAIMNNHFTTLIGYEEGKHWLVFDSYEANSAPFKKIAWDTKFEVVRRYYIAKRTTPPSFWEKLKRFFDI